MSLGAEKLARLSTLLDTAAELEGEAREQWLAALIGEDAELMPTLRRLLARPASQRTDDLLDRGPAFTAIVGAPEEEAAQFKAGERVGLYVLERAIGQGGMGEVWLAMRDDGQLKRRVALKLPMISARRSVLVQRFARERDILGSLAHPNIARLYDAGLGDDGQPYLALEYVEGQPITDYATGHGLDARGRVRLLLQVMQAVQYAHANLVIHRDLKPSNVLVTAQGQAMLLDFGIAKLLQEEAGDAAETELTRVGGRAMTLHYAAPEQVAGAPISIATDVWALGVLLYELLSGRRPFAGKQRDLEQAILGAEPARLGEVPADLATIVLKALKKAPAERYATVNAFAEDLQRWLDGQPVLAQADSAWYRTRKFVGRHKAAVATAAGVLVTVIAASAISVWQARVAREQTRVAQTEAKTAEAVQGFMEGIFRANSGDQADPVKARQRTAKELLDEGAARIDKSLEDAPDAKLRVLKTLGDMYEDMEQLDDAATMHRRRIELARRVRGPGSSAELHALSDLAYQYASMGKMKEADATLKVASALAARPGQSADAMAAFYLAQGWRGSRGDPETAVEPLRQAVALLQDRPPSARLVQALNLYGTSLTQIGHHREALVPLNQAVTLVERDPRLGTSMIYSLQLAIADARAELGEHVKALASYEQALESARRVAGPESKAVVVISQMFGQYLNRRDRRKDGLAMQQQAMRVIEHWTKQADRDSMIVFAIGLSADNYILFGRLPELMVLLDEAVAADLRDPSDPQGTAMMRISRARVLVEWGRYAEALGELDIAAKVLDDGHVRRGAVVETATTARIRIASRTGHPDVAEAARLRWQKANRQPVEPDAKNIVDMGLACEVREGQPDLAEARHICEGALAVSGKNTLTEAELRKSVATVRLRAGDATGAVPLLRQALKRMTEILDPDLSPVILEAHTTLAEALLATQDRAEAKEQLTLARAIAARHVQLAAFYTDPLQRVGRQLDGAAAGAAASPKVPLHGS